MVRYPHSWMAAGRAPLVLCTHSGSLKRTNDKGERCWEIMQEGGEVEGWDSCSGILCLVWSGLGEVRCSTRCPRSWGGAASGGAQPLRASEDLSFPPPFPLPLHSLLLWNPSEDIAVTRTAL